MPSTELRTPRLLLSPPVIADLPRLLELGDDPTLAEMTLNIPHPYREEDAVWWLNKAITGREDGSAYIFAIREGETGRFLGGIGLHLEARHRRAEAGYWIGKPYRGQGYVTEALGRLLRFGFEELDVHRIQATHWVGNPASGRVMLKNGMELEGELKDYYFRDGKARSVFLYRILRGQ